MAKVRPRRLVVDASIGRAAGDRSEGASSHCTKFLNALWFIGHAVVMTGELRAEWRRHRSRVSRAWQQRMFGARRVIVLDRAPDQDFRAGIAEVTPRSGGRGHPA